MKTHLVLFDIDGTLLTSRDPRESAAAASESAGESSLRLALRDRFGLEDDLSQIDIAGRTDSAIARQIFARHGIAATPENLAAFFDGYLAHLESKLQQQPGALLPGIVELLEKLQARPHVALALLTGNLARGAELKLTRANVWQFFAFGAFADDHHDRNELGAFAQKRALEKHGVEFARERTFVLGDTPHDIACGKAFGAKTVGVATGRYTRKELEACAPDFVFDDFSDADAVITQLGL